METQKRRGRPRKKDTTVVQQFENEERITIDDGGQEFKMFEYAVNEIQPLIKQLVETWNEGGTIIGGFKKQYFYNLFNGTAFEMIDNLIFQALDKIDTPLRAAYNDHFLTFKKNIENEFRKLQESYLKIHSQRFRNWPAKVHALRNWPIDDNGNICFDMAAIRQEFDDVLTDPRHVEIYKALKNCETVLNSAIDLIKSRTGNNSHYFGIGLRQRLKIDMDSDKYVLDTTNLKQALNLIID